MRYAVVLALAAGIAFGSIKKVGGDSWESAALNGAAYFIVAAIVFLAILGWQRLRGRF
jgi:hypothetical protein